MKKTIAEMVRDWFKRQFEKPEPEPEIFNPLALRVGATLTINAMDLEVHTFVVKGVTENSGKVRFTDYLCRTALIDKPVEVKVRVYKHDTPGRDLQILVLKCWDTLDYAAEFKALLGENQFDVDEDEIRASFWRINGVKTAYKVTTTDLTTGEVRGRQFWDYWRTARDEGGTEFKEFLFVDWDEDGKDDGDADPDTGRFELWRGEEVGRRSISV